MSKSEECINIYKPTITSAEHRRRRENHIRALRKRTKDAILKKKRAFPNIAVLAKHLFSSNRNLVLGAALELLKLTELGDIHVTDKVAMSGVIPRFVHFLTWNDFIQLQYIGTCTLINITSSTTEKNQDTIKTVAVPLYVNLLHSPDALVRKTAAMALSHAADSPRWRDFALSKGALAPILELSSKHTETELSTLRCFTWTLSNLFRGDPKPDIKQTRHALPVLELLLHSKHTEVVSHACCALVNFASSRAQDRIQAIIDANIGPHFVPLLGHPSLSVLTLILSVIGKITSGADLQAQYVIDHKALPCLLQLLGQNHAELIKDSIYYIISNITAGRPHQIQAVIDAEIMDRLFELSNTDEKTKMAIGWIIYNSICGGTSAQIKYLVSRGCIKLLCDLLDQQDITTVRKSLRALELILYVGKDQKILDADGKMILYAKMIEGENGLDKIVDLREHEHPRMAEKATEIINNYWEHDPVYRTKKLRKKLEFD